MHFPLDELRFFSSRMGPVPGRGVKMAGDADLDSAKELEAAIGDLQNALDAPKASGYETKVKKELTAKSVSQDYDVAKKEWSLNRKWVDPKGGKCELCGHVPIVYQFQIKNKHNHNELIIGSECVLNYVVIDGFTAEDLKKYLNRLRKRLHAGRFDAVEKELLDVWDKQDEVFASLKKLVSQAPDLNVQDFYHRIARFARGGQSGFTLKDTYKNYIQQVGVLARVMEKVYGEARLGKIPDKIERKRKVDGEEVTDQKKLELYIEFETMLKLLFKFGTPTEAYDMILEDFKNHLRGLGDTLNTKRAKVLADVNAIFDAYKPPLGNRTRLKDYVDSWCDMVEARVTETFSNYSAAVSDVDGIVSGRVYVPYFPPEDAARYVRDTFGNWGVWNNRGRGEQKLHHIITSFANFEYIPMTGYAHTPSNSPLMQIKSISGDDLKAAILTCLDRNEMPLASLDELQMYSARVIVTSDFVGKHAKLLERLLADSPAVRQYIDQVAKAEVEARKRQDDAEAERLRLVAEKQAEKLKAEKEFQDLLDDGEKHADPNKPYEGQFVAELRTRMLGNEKRYKTIADLSPRQLSWLRSIATRRIVPQQAPPDANAARATQAPAVPPGGTVMTFTEFLDACVTTMHPGREGGFVSDMRRRYKVWSQLSPRQQKWLQDIFTRADAQGNTRKLPDLIQ
jgi:hypothetical protein